VGVGYSAEQATEFAKKEIIRYPGRDDVTELVMDALMRAAPGGGARAFPPLSSEMPKNMARQGGGGGSVPPATSVVGEDGTATGAAGMAVGNTIDLTSPSPERQPDAKRQKLGVGEDRKGREAIYKGKEVVTIDDGDDDDDGTALSVGGSGGGGGDSSNSLMASLAADRRRREAERGGGAGPASAYAAVPRSTANDRRTHGAGGSSSAGAGAGAGDGILQSLLSAVVPLTVGLYTLERPLPVRMCMIRRRV